MQLFHGYRDTRWQLPAIRHRRGPPRLARNAAQPVEEGLLTRSKNHFDSNHGFRDPFIESHHAQPADHAAMAAPSRRQAYARMEYS
ncbi:hypothetical protein SAMN05216414_10981 [Nitrosovibrio sp. Nv17]|nr:hypothetical protein SAMN05216414_10981 [Nitrosovibrio sp. Nv17]